MASRYWDDLFDCLTARGDELFELVDALLCADGPVRAPVDLASFVREGAARVKGLVNALPFNS